MYAWKYAYEAALCEEWGKATRDRECFTLRINRLSDIVDPISIKKYQRIVKKNE